MKMIQSPTSVQLVDYNLIFITKWTNKQLITTSKNYQIYIVK